VSVLIGAENRSTILMYAANLVTREQRADPVAVGAAALPLLEWAEEAEDPDDLRWRMRAMSRQHANLRSSTDEPCDPGKFVDDAGVHYAFIIAGEQDQ